MDDFHDMEDIQVRLGSGRLLRTHRNWLPVMQEEGLLEIMGRA
jgi:hypothetical protein